MASENVFLLHALLLGIFITFVYDLLRIFRRVVSHNSFFVSLEDLVFWVYCGAEGYLLMYHESDGNLRWFAVLGAMAGMFFYRKLVSKWLVKYVSLILGKVLSIAEKIIRFLFRPFGFVGRKAGSGIRKTRRRIHRFFHHLRRGIKNRLTIFLKLLKINSKA